MDELKRKQVYDILLMPISCTKHAGFNQERKVEIKRQDNIIKTTQTYWPEYIDRTTEKPFRYDFVSDCDMSDFACGFYEIVYKNFLEDRKIVDDNGCLVDKEYAGDTMTSVSQLTKLKKRYHCLANFWVIPMELGRKSKHRFSKTSNYYNIEDFMDRFLLLFKYNLNKYEESFPNYFKKINSFEEFSGINLLCASYVDNKYNIIQYSNMINEEIEEYLWNCIKKRAEIISGKFATELWEYFKNNGITSDEQ